MLRFGVVRELVPFNHPLDELLPITILLIETAYGFFNTRSKTMPSLNARLN